MNNPINPSHYKGFSNHSEVIDITENLSFNGGNAVKYLARATRADGHIKGNPLEDLQKASWYIQREITRLQAQDDESSTVEETGSTTAPPGDALSPWVDGDESSAFPTSDTLKTLDKLDKLFKKLHETPTEEVGHALIYEVADATTIAADIEQTLYNSGLSAADDSQSSPTLYCGIDPVGDVHTNFEGVFPADPDEIESTILVFHHDVVDGKMPAGEYKVMMINYCAPMEHDSITLPLPDDDDDEN